MCPCGAGHWCEFTVLITATEMNDSWAGGFLGSPQRSSAWPWFETMLPWPQTPTHLKCCHSGQGIFKGHFVVCLQWHIKLSSCLWVNKMLHRLYDESMQLNKPLQGEESHDFPAGYWEDVREDKSQSRELPGERTAQSGGPQVMQKVVCPLWPKGEASEGCERLLNFWEKSSKSQNIWETERTLIFLRK